MAVLMRFSVRLLFWKQKTAVTSSRLIRICMTPQVKVWSRVARFLWNLQISISRYLLLTYLHIYLPCMLAPRFRTNWTPQYLNRKTIDISCHIYSVHSSPISTVYYTQYYRCRYV